jgi:hypothetical protein
MIHCLNTSNHLLPATTNQQDQTLSKKGLMGINIAISTIPNSKINPTLIFIWTLILQLQTCQIFPWKNKIPIPKLPPCHETMKSLLVDLITKTKTNSHPSTKIVKPTNNSTRKNKTKEEVKIPKPLSIFLISTWQNDKNQTL